MKKLFVTILSVITAAFLTFSVIDNVEAKRMGGGKSFGSKNTYNQSAAKPAPSQTQLTNRQQNATQRGALTQRGGIMGMLGGLALGGLLGALLFGGAFENINFFDILIFGAIAFLLYKLFARKKHAPGLQPQGIANSTAQTEPAQRPFDTDLMFRKTSAATGEGRNEPASPAANPQTAWTPSGSIIPKDFDSENFLEGAKAAYRRLQSAWDEGDLADIRQFSTDAVFGEVQDQFRARQGENRTELLKLDAELLEVRESGLNIEASVLFDAILREIDADSPADVRPDQRREIWHFTRPTNSKQPTWYLDGIQQIED